MRICEPTDALEDDQLSEADLAEGTSIVRVELGPSTRADSTESRRFYSTRLTNFSTERVRVLKSAGYSKHGDHFELNTTTGRFFTATDFIEWYGVQGEWIEPGASVVDPNNFGTPPTMWAHYCETESGRRFVTGGIIK